MLMHRCWGAASLGSSPQRGDKSKLLQWMLPFGAFRKKLVLCACMSVGLLFPANYSKRHYKREAAAMVQDSCDSKNRGWANHPAFPILNKIFICGKKIDFVKNFNCKKMFLQNIENSLPAVLVSSRNSHKYFWNLLLDYFHRSFLTAWQILQYIDKYFNFHK